MLRDMVPDAYRDRAEARSFRERHAGTLRDTAAVRRVRDRLVSGTTHVISQSEVDDWIVAIGLSRFLYTHRKAKKVDQLGFWISHIQATLLIAMNPKLAGL